MSGPTESRAAVFTRSPQSVEVYQAGTWWQGELLGWRHDASGTCQMWVRVVVGGVEETAWIDLAALRLPERDLSPATEPSRIDSRVKQELPPAQAVSALRGRPVSGNADATAALPLIRDEAPPPAGSAAAAAPAASGTRPGGRRRAPEDADVQVVVAAQVPVPAGRHRAPGDEGRHRAADTEVFAAVADEAEPVAAVSAEARPEAESRPQAESRRATRPHVGGGWAVFARTARPEESFGRPEVCTGRIDAEPDLLTRPMRLGDLGPSSGSRRPRVSGSLSGV
ncbi:hypothetical protein [Blastococcus goldschmidtiae]|uniref:Agenet domain-containing protein n=1 Tax=Blastococcus goldschmidtiae TaxID=3075546 RepID=A0ABU2K8L5_9ACTN|nr:hypothetical protein [Blastococcus sp. DSM 46792]MDT0276536.1 hypothetical protein [Blastococcus sp. DSM 46792]